MHSSVSRVAFPVVGFTLITKMRLIMNNANNWEGKCKGNYIFTRLQLCIGILVDLLSMEHPWNLSKLSKQWFIHSLSNELAKSDINSKKTMLSRVSAFHIPAPVIFDPLKDVFPVARAPSKLALLRLAWRKWFLQTQHTRRENGHKHSN